MTECNGCGACCNPVRYDVASLRQRMTEHEPSDEWYVMNQANIDFILAHWHDNGDATATCDHFDPATLLCTAHDERPPICADFPFYNGEPTNLPLSGFTLCAFYADLPEDARPADWQPVSFAALHRDHVLPTT